MILEEVSHYNFFQTLLILVHLTKLQKSFINQNNSNTIIYLK